MCSVEEPLAEKRTVGVGAKENMSVIWATEGLIAC